MGRSRRSGLDARSMEHTAAFLAESGMLELTDQEKRRNSVRGHDVDGGSSMYVKRQVGSMKWTFEGLLPSKSPLHVVVRNARSMHHFTKFERRREARADVCIIWHRSGLWHTRYKSCEAKIVKHFLTIGHLHFLIFLSSSPPLPPFALAWSPCWWYVMRGAVLYF